MRDALTIAAGVLCVLCLVAVGIALTWLKSRATDDAADDITGFVRERPAKRRR